MRLTDIFQFPGRGGLGSDGTPARFCATVSTPGENCSFMVGLELHTLMRIRPSVRLVLLFTILPIQSVFTEREFDELVNIVRTELLPKLANLRIDAQSNHDSSEDPEGHMQNVLETFRTLKKRFGENADALKLISPSSAVF
jgi:hypothetical protein